MKRNIYGINILNVADWFLVKESMRQKKLQKLCYYAEAWCETLLKKPISNNCEFQAWVHGPVNESIWNKYRSYGWCDISQINEEDISDMEADIIGVLDSVWETYGEYTGEQLEWLTHQEKPWLEQREGLEEFESSRNVISVNTMKSYYGELTEAQS